MEWIHSSRRARTFGRLVLFGTAAIVAVNAAVYAWRPHAWSPGYMLALSVALPFLWLVDLTQIPTAVALDGGTLRVRYFIRERDIGLADIVAADLAPGAQRGLADLRLALGHDGIVTLILEPPAAERLAALLEGTGRFVNRTPPPAPRVPPHGSRRPVGRKGF